MTPEQRAKRAVSALAEGGAALVDFEWAERIIARAIRSERNAILESVALDREKNGHGQDSADAARYRSWKTRAPKRRAAR